MDIKEGIVTGTRTNTGRDVSRRAYVSLWRRELSIAARTKRTVVAARRYRMLRSQAVEYSQKPVTFCKLLRFCNFLFPSYVCTR